MRTYHASLTNADGERIECELMLVEDHFNPRGMVFQTTGPIVCDYPTLPAFVKTLDVLVYTCPVCGTDNHSYGKTDALSECSKCRRKFNLVTVK